MVQTQKSQILEEINIDVNNVLNFSINIDNLKILLTTLIKNQSTLSEKIVDLEKRIKGYHSKGSSMKSSERKSERKNLIMRASKTINQSPKEENTQKRMSLVLQSDISEKINEENGGVKEEEKTDININKDENVEKKKEKKKKKENEENKENEKKDLMESIKEESNADNEYLDSSFDKTRIYDMENKLNSLEKKIKNLEMLNRVNKFTAQGGPINNDDFQLMQVEMKNLKDSNKKILQENLEFKTQLENINVKLADINIYDLFKDLNASNGSIDVAKTLVMNLENKVFKKIAFIDERDKKLNQDMMDLKTNIQNVINKNGVITHNMENIKNNLKELGELLGNNSTETINMINNVESKMNNIHKEIISKYDEERDKMNINIKKINDKLFNLEKLNNAKLNPSDIKTNNNNVELTKENLEFIQKMANRINEIESKINTILETSLSYSTKDDIIKIEKELLKKVNTKEFFELKDKYNLQLAKINNLEDGIERAQDLNEKNSSDLIFYAKRIEGITSNLISVRTQLEDLIKREKNQVLDLSHFLEKSVFNKYLKSLQPEKLKMENNFEELRTLVNNMSNTLTKKCNAEDFKIFEDIINSKLEEFKLLNTKKFADKIDTNRSMKYLDSQIRHIIDIYIKRINKNESWLIAKKPINGFSCASCESFIGGELKNKEGGYMPWNKYPQRDKDQNYRVGNGFSRMLNMLNIELKNSEMSSNEKEIESDDEVKKYFDENRIKIRIKNSSSNKDIKEKINKNNISAMIRSSSNNNIFNSPANSKNTNTNILPKLFLNKNEEYLTLEPNSSVVNDINFEKNFMESNGEDNKEAQQSNDNQPHIVKIFKKARPNTNMNDNPKMEKIYPYTKK